MTRTLLILAFLSLLFACSAKKVADPGNGSETTNGYYALVLGTDGRPVSGAEVFMRPADYLRDTSLVGKEPVPSKLTDSSGRFHMDSLADSATLEVLFGKKESLLKLVNEKPQTGLVDTLRLVPATALYGIVDRSNIEAGAKIFVQIRGLERVVEADSEGAFSFSSLPPGEHKLRIVTDRSQYGVTEGDTLQTAPGEQRNGGSFILPFDFWRDTAAVRSILNANGLATVAVDSVVKRNKEGRIVALNLEGRGLTRLTPDIGMLRLRNLSLGNNQLDSLHDAVGQIFTLQVLSMKQNRLVYVPGSIGDLRDLSVLDLSDNQLGSLPESITMLVNLSTLSVSGNLLRLAKPPVSTWLDNYCTDTLGGDWKASQR